ncbi:MAG: hypothetical protein OEM52_13480 [bacterium]|nr:hypothetical protein [bacterium]
MGKGNLRAILLHLLLIVGFVDFSVAEIRFNEVMIDPVGGNQSNSFLEFYVSTSDSISIRGYRIEFDGAAHWLIRDIPDWNIGNGYLLMFPGSYPRTGGRYDTLIPPGVPRFTITSPYFGSGIINPTIPLWVKLFDSSSVIIDSIKTEPVFQRGYSAERVFTNLALGNSDWNWSANLDGTPGSRNSNTPPIVDLGITRCAFYPPPGNTRTPTFIVQIIGLGEYPVSSQLKLKFRRLPQQALIEYTGIAVPALAYRENWQVEIPANPVDSFFGWLGFQVELSQSDSIVNNDSLSGFAYHWSPVFPVFTERMARPALGQPAWFELFWQGERSAQFGSWKIVVNGDSILLPFHGNPFSSGTRFVVAASELPVEYGVNREQVVIPATWHEWGTRGADIELVAPWGEVIETLPFGTRYPIEPVQGVSFVRRSLSLPASSASNWYNSRDQWGAAPGRPDAPDSVIIDPIPVPSGNFALLQAKRFAPDGAAGLLPELLITVETTGGDWRFEILDMAGRRRWERKLRMNPGTHPVTWSGVDRSGEKVATGVYLVQAFWNDHRVFRSSCVVVR